MKITVKDIQGICLMAISGRIDSSNSVDLESALYKAINENSRIIMDLADAEYVSSSGLRVLLAGKKMLKERDGEMILISLQPMVRDVFEIAGLAQAVFDQKKFGRCPPCNEISAVAILRDHRSWCQRYLLLSASVLHGSAGGSIGCTQGWTGSAGEDRLSTCRPRSLWT